MVQETLVGEEYHSNISHEGRYRGTENILRRKKFVLFNPLNLELNHICYLLALLAHYFLHVSRIRFKPLTLRLLMSYIYIYIYIHIWSAYS